MKSCPRKRSAVVLHVDNKVNVVLHVVLDVDYQVDVVLDVVLHVVLHVDYQVDVVLQVVLDVY